MKTFLFACLSISVLWINAQNLIRVPQDAALLSSAVQMASTGDTIYISAGTYTDSVHINNKQLVIRGDTSGTSIFSPGLNQKSFILLNSDVEFINLTFDDFQQNSAAPNYAIYADYSNIKINKCHFNKLRSPVYLFSGHLAVSHSSFVECRGIFSIMQVGGTFWMHNNLFYGRDHSGVIINRANGQFFNNTLIGNTLNRNYGILINSDSISHIFNNIIEGFGRGIYLIASDSIELAALRIYNNNIYNVTHLYRYEYNQSLSQPIFYGAIIPNPGTGEISVYSNFVDTINNNYNLRSGSSCIDAGINSYPASIVFDFNGNNRFNGTHPDIGAFEYSSLTGLSEHGNGSTIKIEIYPLPSSGNITVKLNQNFNGKLEVLDVSGKTIKRININGKDKIMIDLPEVKGLYFLRLMDRKSVIVKKVIKV